MGYILSYGTNQNAGGGGGAGGIGAPVNYASPNGVLDPVIPGFGPNVGRVNLTLSGNTTWQGLPAGTDGQQLYITVAAGNFTFTLLHNSGATALKPILASNDFSYALGDTAQLFYSGGLGKWVLVA